MKCAIFPILLTFALSACATATRGSAETIVINSEPVGATALTDIPSKKKRAVSGFLGCEPTPCGISLSRRSDPIITISKPGYQPIKFKVTSSQATSSVSVMPGSLVAGIPPQSHVIAGSPDFLKRIPSGTSVVLGAVPTLGAGAVVDIAVGANKNLSPNPVIVFLAPIKVQNLDIEAIQE